MKIIICVLLICLLIFLYKDAPNIHSQNQGIFWWQRHFTCPPLPPSGPVTIFLTGGLCNRLRTLLGFYFVLQKRKRALIVVWKVTPVCNGAFTDIFEPLEGIHFIENYSEPTFTGDLPLEKLLPHFGYKVFDKRIREIYSVLRLKPEIKIKIQHFVERYTLSARIGFHIRRTDHSGTFVGKLLNPKTANDTYFESQIEASGGVFLSTDNFETQKKFLKHPQVVVYSQIPDSDELRKTTLEHAVIDLWCLAHCSHVVGTQSSSFSTTARYLEKIV